MDKAIIPYGSPYGKYLLGLSLVSIELTTANSPASVHGTTAKTKACLFSLSLIKASYSKAKAAYTPALLYSLRLRLLPPFEEVKKIELIISDERKHRRQK
jgi:hypothetical protein